MDVVMIILIVCILLCFFFIWYINVYNKFQEYIIRINEAEANIDSVLRKRFDLLNKSIGIIKTNTKEKGEILTVIDELRSKMLSNFELDRVLYDALNEFHTYSLKYDELKRNDAFTKIEIGLNESEAEITAFRKYYNDIITNYNKLAKVFPSVIVAKLCKYKAKTYYDGKNMEDDITNDFKL
ncbi:MAG: LemA family protein [Bacilli bacterium]|jgi:LemA protein|nr:LemA family protein [Bacilli bacterium]